MGKIWAKLDPMLKKQKQTKTKTKPKKKKKNKLAFINRLFDLDSIHIEKLPFWVHMDQLWG